MVKYVIVGGVAAGASAAARLRRCDEFGEIVLLERTAHVSFANCGLPYYVGGEIRDSSRLLIQTPQALKQRFRIDVRVESEVLSVDCKRRCVVVRHRGGESDESVYEESYDKLLLCPGAKPIRPALKGIESERIMTLRTIADVENIQSRLCQVGQAPSSIAVIGGGFIGLEMADNLRRAGYDVVLVEAENQVLPPFDEDMASIVLRMLQSNGVKLEIGRRVIAFEEKADLMGICLDDGRWFEASYVILAIGIQPDTAFLRGSGVALNARGYIQVDAHLQTNMDGVYAAGDAIELYRRGVECPMTLALAGPANRQGRCAADNMSGKSVRVAGMVGSSIVKVFDRTVACTGMNSRELSRLGIAYHEVVGHPMSHATYYPGAEQMTLKLLFGEDGRVLGAQGFGGAGVDKRIDVVATVISLGGMVEDLTELELCYAPPYSSAKDPVNMIGYMAENVLDGMTTPISYRELSQALNDGACLIDVRTPSEYAQGHLAGAINIPVDAIRDRLESIDKSRKIIVYCQVGLRGYYAERILKQHGYDVRNLTGGYRFASFLLSSL